MAKENALVQYEPSTQIKDLMYQANVIMEANIYKDVGLNPNKAFLKIQIAKDLGLSLTAGLMGVRVNDSGVLSFTTEMMKALVQNNGKWRWRVIENTAKIAKLEWDELRSDTWVKIGVSDWTIEEAVAAELFPKKDNWKKYPKDMLFARAASRGIRMFCPIVAMGHPVYSHEEVESDDSSLDSDGNLKEVFNKSFVKKEDDVIDVVVEEREFSDEYIMKLLGEANIDMFTIKKTYNVKSLGELNNKKRKILVDNLLKGSKV